MNLFTSLCKKKPNPLKTRGFGPWRYEWYSICSKHYHHKDTCNLCQAGSWVNVYEHAITSYICKADYPLWLWWVNDSKYPKLMVLIKHFLYGKVGIKHSFKKS